MRHFPHRRSLSRSLLTAGWTLALAVAASGATPLGTEFTYQGRLEFNDGPIDGTCDCRFTLWDDAIGGAQIGPALLFNGQGPNPPPVSLSDSLFTVELDFGAGAFNGDARWLEIAVACPSGGRLEVLGPRQPLTASPYALYALDNACCGDQLWTANGDDIHNANAGYVGIGLDDPEVPLHVRENVQIGGFIGGATIIGHNTATAGIDSGIFGVSDSVTGRGVVGFALATSGANYAVAGHTASPQGYGAYFTGVSGSRNYFQQRVGIGIEAPVYTLQVESNLIAGTYSRTDATPGIGVQGRSTSPNAFVTGFGVLGVGDGPVSAGVRGYASSNSGVNYAVQGETNSPSGYAAYFTGPSGSRNYFQRSVGIGTSTPLSELHVVGADNDGTDAALRVVSGSQRMLIDGNEIDSNFTGGLHLNNNNDYDVVLALGGGNVGVGTQNTANYRLAVNGSIRAKEITVETGWSDFVFDPDYDLASLKEVERHIQEHGHLPDIPSADEVAANGVKVGEMESKLLQKVEELTLHLIAMDKRLASLEEENAQLKAQLGQASVTEVE